MMRVDPIRAGICQIDPAFAGSQEGILRGGRHEGVGRFVELVAWLAVEEIGAKHFESAIGEDLSPMTRLGVRQMTVIALPGDLEPLPEIHHVNDVLYCILRPEKAIGK